MIKKLMSAAMIAISLVAIPATAQNLEKGTKGGKSCNKECVEKGREFKARGCRINNPDRYAGMTLSDSQRQQLAALDSTECAARRTQAEQWKARKEQQKQDKMQAKEQNKELSKEERKALAEERKAEKQQLREERRIQSQSERRDYLKKVKDIVGPEQYVIFLENEFVMTPAQGPQGAKAMKMDGRRNDNPRFDHASKGGKMQKADRGDKGGKDKASKGDKSNQQKGGKNKSEKKG